MLSTAQALVKLRAIKLVEKGKVINYSQFKNRATVHRYGSKRIVLAGTPNKSLFAFYPTSNGDSEAMKEAYKLLKQLEKLNTEPLKTKLVQWGNGDIPVTYSNLQKSKS